MKAIVKVVSFSLICLLSACVSIPQKLQLPEDLTAVPFKQLKESTTDFIGEKARWGGVIASVKNLKNSTVIEVVNFPLGLNAKPKAKNDTLGRFKIYHPGLLDPIIYKRGLSVTAVGTISAAEAGKIGEFDYNFPVLQAEHIHLWKHKPQVNIRVERDPFAYDHFGWSHHPRYFYQRPYTRIRVGASAVNTKKTLAPASKK